ncbi:hypothetical protein [Photobacterium chitinilyticum]|uniref:hypothetical protein n=1 Tax=Photobacterium chitinilyticum TaxID=2485123 RepID=UPI000FFE5F81|nr:hypothetical protein [Photobacterium chitinilyticum]
MTAICCYTVKRPADSEQLDERTWFLEDSGKQCEIVVLIDIHFTAQDAQATLSTCKLCRPANRDSTSITTGKR